ncbi:high mobility group protein B3, putative (HMGB3) [Plasmodium ovale wallikeri]|uniref:High mobility group protein B3, putative (HMGB3) n=1 Tax=Plasmodium ovale wallikeri TaxID=864142 RepID=A0A1A8ZJH8_PLAOA|nr:high mobility group protein B3, putative (HMGB3) [Plasmodium ovale wallikeri]
MFFHNNSNLNNVDMINSTLDTRVLKNGRENIHMENNYYFNENIDKQASQVNQAFYEDETINNFVTNPQLQMNLNKTFNGDSGMGTGYVDVNYTNEDQDSDEEKDNRTTYYYSQGAETLGGIGGIGGINSGNDNGSLGDMNGMGGIGGMGSMSGNIYGGNVSNGIGMGYREMAGDPSVRGDANMSCATSANNVVYSPEEMFTENKMKDTLVYFDAELNGMAEVMEDTEMSAPKGKQFFNHASHFLELIKKKNIRKTKNCKSSKDPIDEKDTIWERFLKVGKMHRKGDSQECTGNVDHGYPPNPFVSEERSKNDDISYVNFANELCEGNSFMNESYSHVNKEDGGEVINCILNIEENGNVEKEVICSETENCNEEAIRSEADKCNEEAICSEADKCNVEAIRSEDDECNEEAIRSEADKCNEEAIRSEADKCNEEASPSEGKKCNDDDGDSSCDDILSLLNLCDTEGSNVLKINERGEVTYDDTRNYDTSSVANDIPRKNNTSLLMKSKYDMNEDFSRCQIEQYKDAYKRRKACKWSDDDTNRFYEAIEMFGIDLMMVRALLPSFTDKQIRDKYKKEKKMNPQKIEQAVRANKEIDLDAYEREHGKIDNSTCIRYYDLTSSDNGKITLTKGSGGKTTPSPALHTPLSRCYSSRYVLVTFSLRSRCALVTLSLRSRCALVTLSLRSRYALVTLSLRSRYALVTLSLRSRYALVTLLCVTISCCRFPLADDNSMKRKTSATSEPEVNILSIFDYGEQDAFHTNVLDTIQEDPDFNVLALF